MSVHPASAVIALLLIFNCTWPSSAGAGWLRCSPERLYRADTLTVDLPVPHDNYELGLTPIDGSDDLILISFKPTPRDTIAPVIPPGVFAKMKQVKLDTRTALGSLSNSAWRVPDGPIAVRTPAPIFTKPKSYEVVLGPVLY